MYTLVGYVEARFLECKNEEIVFAKKAQGESYAEVLKGGHLMMKSDIKIIFMEMNSVNHDQEENPLKKMLSSINDFFKNAHDKVTAATEQKLNVFHKEKCNNGEEMLTAPDKNKIGLIQEITMRREILFLEYNKTKTDYNPLSRIHRQYAYVKAHDAVRHLAYGVNVLYFCPDSIQIDVMTMKDNHKRMFS